MSVFITDKIIIDKYEQVKEITYIHPPAIARPSVRGVKFEFPTRLGWWLKKLQPWRYQELVPGLLVKKGK